MSIVQITPIFRAEWQQEYTEAEYQPQTLRTVCRIGALYFLFNFLFTTFGDEGVGTGGNFLWKFFTLFPNLICSIAYCSIAIILNIRSWRPFCIRSYNSICVFQITSSYLSVLLPQVMLEIRRARYQRVLYPYIHWDIDYSSFLPLRKCFDADPISTWTSTSCSDDGTSVGCENTILAGGMLGTYIVLNFIPVMYRMSPKSAAIVCLINSFAIVVALLSTGTWGSTLYSYVGFQIIAGIASAFFCRNQKILSKKQFAVIKGTKFASEQHKTLLYTLIPKNVVAKLASHDGKGLLGTSINRCTVMFCALEPHEEMQVMSVPMFELMNQIFSEFDRVVQSHGMFKYQHVSDWYIVACPRAANPFDDDEQAKPYPTQYTAKMILLAEELRSVAKQYKVGSVPLWLKVGINCGPVAGAVIGLHRSFYCLYGDTINTAARMCKASDGKIFCTDDINQLTKGIPSDVMTSMSKGIREIKGKGSMEIFAISVNHRSRAINKDAAEDLDQVEAPKFSRQNSWNYGMLSAPFLERTAGNLSEEALQWVKDQQRRIDPVMARFADPPYEARFLKAQWRGTRQGLMAGLTVQLCTLGCQWGLAIYPEYRYDFDGLGDKELDEARRAVFRVLSIHWGIVSAYCIALIAAIWKYQTHENFYKHNYMLLKLVHMAVSTVAFRKLPVLWGLMMLFAFEMICLHCAMATLSFRQSVVLVGISFLVFATALSFVRCFEPYTLAKVFAFAAAAILLSRMANVKRRLRWRLQDLFESELDRLQEKLCDLLPSRVARAMIEASDQQSCEGSEAAVLQLDICGFTAMSGDLSPMALAEMVHTLFSAFDVAVQAGGLFKMDTVGDAYLVAALLPAYPAMNASEADGGLSSSRTASASAVSATSVNVSSVNSNSQSNNFDEAVRLVDLERSRACEQLLAVARTMIESVDAYRLQTGRAVRCRIGVSVGPVLTGVLGVLQPRFHMYGPCMRSAEALEQSGVPGAVHASATFASALCASSMSGPGTRDNSVDRSRESLGSRNSGGWWQRVGSMSPAKLLNLTASVGGASPSPTAPAARDKNGSWWIEEPELVFADMGGRAMPNGGATSSKVDRAVGVNGGNCGCQDAGGRSTVTMRNGGTHIDDKRSDVDRADITTDNSEQGIAVNGDAAERNGIEISAENEAMWSRRGWAVVRTNVHIGCNCPPKPSPVAHANNSTCSSAVSSSHEADANQPTNANGKHRRKSVLKRGETMSTARASDSRRTSINQDGRVGAARDDVVISTSGNAEQPRRLGWVGRVQSLTIGVRSARTNIRRASQSNSVQDEMRCRSYILVPNAVSNPVAARRS